MTGIEESKIRFMEALFCDYFEFRGRGVSSRHYTERHVSVLRKIHELMNRDHMPAVLVRAELERFVAGWKNMLEIVAVTSGKGGVGKTTVAVNLAVALAQMGAKVGILDADIYGPNVPIMLGVDSLPPLTSEQMTPAFAHGVEIMSIGFLVPDGEALIWRGPMLHKAISQLFTDVAWGVPSGAKGGLDYMIVDLPPGTGDAQLSLAQLVPLTGGIIVSTPQEVSLSDARRGFTAFQRLSVPVLGIVENMAGAVFGVGGGEHAAAALGVPFLGRIELESEIREGGDAGKPAVACCPESSQADAFRAVARKVAAQVSVMNAQRPAAPKTPIKLEM
jgi:ATP-binding protein involved in chromosome partitioning